MKINAVSNCNYTQNSRNQNFKGLYFKEKTLQTIAQNCSIDEVKILKATAADKIDLRSLLHSDVTNPIREHLFLKLGDNASDLKLIYEPYINENYIPGPRTGFGEAGRLRYYALGGKFEILGYVPPLPKYSDCIFLANGDIQNPSKKTTPLIIEIDENNTSSFNVYSSCNDVFDTKNVESILKENGIIPNGACPIPTKEFVRGIVKKVYKYLIDENVKYFNIAENASEKAKLLEETEALRQQYTKEQLGNFVYTV